MLHTFTFNELFAYSLFVGGLGFFGGCALCTIVAEYYRQVGYEYKKELARKEFKNL